MRGPAKVVRALPGMFVLAVILSGCVTTRSSCTVPNERKGELLKRVAMRIAELTDESFTYSIDQALTPEKNLYRLRNGRCYAYLFPMSRKGEDFLDGDGGMYVDLNTLAVGEAFWFSY
jgi:hypothetical protein